MDNATNPQSLKHRYKYISISKGIGIVLVVIGHCINGQIGRFIYLFHMPLFFIVTGYLYKNLKERSTKTFLLSKIKALYIPYVVANFFFLLFHNFFFTIGFYQEGYLNLERLKGIGEYFRDLLGILSLTHMEQITAPTWYLRVLLIGSIVYLFLNKIIKSEVALSAICLLFYLTAFVLYYADVIDSNTMIYGTLVLLSVAFMRCGYLYRIIESHMWFQYRVFFAIISFAALIGLSFIGKINIVEIELENPIFLILCSFLGTYLVLCISRIIENFKYSCVLQYIGDHSLSILILHCFAFKIVNCFYYLVSNDWESLKHIANANTIPWALAYIGIGISFPLLVDLFYRKAHSAISRHFRR